MAEKVPEIRTWLAEAAKRAGGTPQLAAAIGEAKNTVYGWLSGPSEPRASQVVAIVRATGIEVPWSAIEPRLGFSESQMPFQLPPVDLVFIPRLEVNASAGPGAIAGSEEAVGEMAFSRELLRGLGVTSPGALRVLAASGDSMEPLIRPGDLLLVDTGIDSVIDDGVYVVVFDGALIVKRLAKGPKGVLLLVSENPRVPAMTVAREDLHEIHVAGRVVRVIRAL